MKTYTPIPGNVMLDFMFEVHQAVGTIIQLGLQYDKTAIDALVGRVVNKNVVNRHPFLPANNACEEALIELIMHRKKYLLLSSDEGVQFYAHWVLNPEKRAGVEGIIYIRWSPLSTPQSPARRRLKKELDGLFPHLHVQPALISVN